MFALLIALLLAQDDFDSARSELYAALSDGDPAAIQQGLSRLVSFQNRRVPPALVEGVERATQLLKSLEKERIKLEKTMEETQDRYVNGRNQGNPVEFLKAREQWVKVTGRIAALELYRPRLLRAMSSLTGDEAVAAVVATLRHPTWYVRGYGVAALAGSKDEAARKALAELASGENEPAVRVALADAFAGRADARTALEGWLRDPCWSVTVASARALAAGRDRRSAEALILALKGTEGRVQHEINEALKTVTGVDKHGSFDAWMEWWTLNREEFVAGRYVPKPSERAEAPGGSTFYGVRVHSTRILFILDVSSSMLEPAAWVPEGRDAPKGKRCIDVAQYELKRILRCLPDGAEYNVMLLHNGTTLAFEKAGRGRAHLDKAVRFIDGIKILDGTNISGALFRGFDLCGGADPLVRPPSGGFDTIFLVSDGEATGGIVDTSVLVERLTEMNRFRKIAVSGVGVSATVWGEALLKQVAAATGGDYVRR
ncbi:MAG: hypothetical protein HYY17_09710 [Planctomycetes bacterium]|nr:hypothetical protein [Planctomycetota bacterium]